MKFLILLAILCFASFSYAAEVTMKCQMEEKSVDGTNVQKVYDETYDALSLPGQNGQRSTVAKFGDQNIARLYVGSKKMLWPKTGKVLEVEITGFKDGKFFSIEVSDMNGEFGNSNILAQSRIVKIYLLKNKKGKKFNNLYSTKDENFEITINCELIRN